MDLGNRQRLRLGHPIRSFLAIDSVSDPNLRPVPPRQYDSDLPRRSGSRCQPHGHLPQNEPQDFPHTDVELRRDSLAIVTCKAMTRILTTDYLSLISFDEAACDELKARGNKYYIRIVRALGHCLKSQTLARRDYAYYALKQTELPAGWPWWRAGGAGQGRRWRRRAGSELPVACSKVEMAASHLVSLSSGSHVSPAASKPVRHTRQ